MVSYAKPPALVVRPTLALGVASSIELPNSYGYLRHYLEMPRQALEVLLKVAHLVRFDDRMHGGGWLSFQYICPLYICFKRKGPNVPT